MNLTDQLASDAIQPARRHTRICDPCMDAAQDEGAASLEAIRFLCVEIGADISDHHCETTDYNRRCDCACH